MNWNLGRLVRSDLETVVEHIFKHLSERQLSQWDLVNRKIQSFCFPGGTKMQRIRGESVIGCGWLVDPDTILK